MRAHGSEGFRQRGDLGEKAFDARLLGLCVDFRAGCEQVRLDEFLHRAHLAARIRDRAARALHQGPELPRDDPEAEPGLARARRFDAGIERQHVVRVAHLLQNMRQAVELLHLIGDRRQMLALGARLLETRRQISVEGGEEGRLGRVAVLHEAARELSGRADEGRRVGERVVERAQLGQQPRGRLLGLLDDAA